MAYTALYREWRPDRFDRVVGQEHVTRTLRRAVERGRISHAYLFCGPRGTGKTSVAKILARAVNCERPRQGDPCGECPPCRSIAAGAAVDVLEIDAASNRGIDEVRDLREKVRYAPSGLRWKTYIIDEVHMLTEPAFNALLKTLEEPPAHALFVLATTEIQKIPATILSRCQRFDFHRLSVDEIRSRLAEVCAAQGVAAEPEALTSIALHAEGGLRDALSLLDQILAFGGDEAVTVQRLQELLGLADEAALARLAQALLEKNLIEFLQVTDELSRAGRELRQVLRDLVLLFRDILLAAASGEAAPLSAPGLLDFIRDAAGRYPLQACEAVLRRLAAGEAEIRRGGSVRTFFELLGVEICLAGQEPSGSAAETPGEARRQAADTTRPQPRRKEPPPAPGAAGTEEADHAGASGRKLQAETAAAGKALSEAASDPAAGTRPEGGLARLWPRVQEVLSRKSMVLSALFAHIDGVEERDGGLVLRLRGTKELAARFEEPGNRRMIEEALQAAAKRRVAFRVEAVAEASQRPSRKGAGSRTQPVRSDPDEGGPGAPSPRSAAPAVDAAERAAPAAAPEAASLKPEPETSAGGIEAEIQQIFGGRWLDGAEPWEDEADG